MSGLGIKFPASRGSKSLARFRGDDAQVKRWNKGHAPRPGYPKDGTLTALEALDYLESDPMTCLLCGRGLQALGQHVTKVHKITPKEYCRRYGIPHERNGSHGLATRKQRERQSRDQLAAQEKDPGLLDLRRSIHLRSTRRGGHTMSEVSRTIRKVTSKTAPRPCQGCGRQFKPHHSTNRFCSKKCSAPVSGARRRKGPPRCCADCGNQLPQGSQGNKVKRCMSCYRQHVAARI